MRASRTIDSRAHFSREAKDGVPLEGRPRRGLETNTSMPNMTPVACSAPASRMHGYPSNGCRLALHFRLATRSSGVSRFTYMAAHRTTAARAKQKAHSLKCFHSCGANEAITRRSQRLEHDTATPIREQAIPIFMLRRAPRAYDAAEEYRQ
jgi:hypothetical protein